MSAPSDRQVASLSSEPAVAATVAPSACASWIAIVPIPPAPPCTRNVSPGWRPAIMNTLDHTVAATSGSADAVTRSTPAGTGITWPAGTATLSAYPPDASRAHTSSPTDQASTPWPTALIVPEHSIPSTSDAPGGGG
jgi:hypothetical protein